MQKIRRCYITLVELMIVLTILLMMTGVVGINIRKAFQQQRFRTEVDLVVDTLRLAQDLMLIVGADVHFRMWSDDKYDGIQYRLEVDGDIPKAWQPIIKRSYRLLKEIYAVELPQEDSIGRDMDIKFLSGGSMMSRGVLRMSTHQDFDAPGALKRVVLLRGYPHAIESVPEYDEPIELEDEEDAEFDARLTTYTTQEILEDEPPEKTVESEEAKKEDKKEGPEAPRPPP